MHHMPTSPQGTSSAAAPLDTDVHIKTSSSSAPSSAKPASGGPGESSQTNVKETIESILVAFILAFVFRAFVVEAFVIPTGSMAPTLYGAHIRMQCPDCGYTFDVGYSSRDRNDDTNIQSEAQRPPVRCPNCNFLINSNPRQAVRFGDRILVQKYLYLFENPHRWDVVVFKSPDEQGKHDAKDPEYAQNYIKRLVGLPDSSIVVLDGDVYSGPFNASGPADFHIERKSPSAQQALWRTVYDNDYIPHLDPGERDAAWRQPWQTVSGGKGWNLGDAAHSSRTFTFDNSDGLGAISFLPDEPHTHGLNDWLAYDVVEWGSGHVGTGGFDPPQPVSDLKLSCFYRRNGGEGPLQLLMTKSEDCFMARIDRGKLSLVHATRASGMNDEDLRIQGETVLQTIDLPALSSADFVQLELENVDYRVAVRVNGKKVLETTDAQYSPKVAELWDRAEGGAVDPFAYPVVRIEAARQSCTIQHLLLSRDIYYLGRGRGYSLYWAIPDSIVHLGRGEYFVLGDNSLVSGDARTWHVPVELPREGLPFVESGRVPERFMLGRAFFVYWPAGYRPGSWIPYSIIPDFGEMRFIH